MRAGYTDAASADAASGGIFLGTKAPSGGIYGMNGIYPIGSMYGKYGNIYHQYTPNVSIYTIHGSYGYRWLMTSWWWMNWWSLSLWCSFFGFVWTSWKPPNSLAHCIFPASRKVEITKSGTCTNLCTIPTVTQPSGISGLVEEKICWSWIIGGSI